MKMIITAAMLDITNVTAEQIGRAYKCFDEKGIPFYMVESSRDLFDSEGKRVEYKVTWDRKKGFRCTCKSGQKGFANCGAKKVCQHVLASVAAAQEEKEAFNIPAPAPVAVSARVASLKALAHRLVSEGLDLTDEDRERFGLTEYAIQ